MQVLVQAFHDVRERIDMNNLRLGTKKLSEVLKFGKVFRLANSATFPGRDGVFDRVHAEVLQGLISVTAKLHAFVEVLRPLIVEVDGRNERR